MIKAAFFDVDGTLFSHVTHSVPKSARESVAALRRKGVKAFLCTGRHITELEKLPLADMVFDGYITLNGHLCLDGDKTLLRGMPFPQWATDSLVEVFTKEKRPLVLVEEDGLTLNFVNDTVLRAQKTVSSEAPKVGKYEGKPVYQASTYATREEDDIVRALMPPCFRTARWSEEGVDIILEGGGKTAGIRFFTERLGIGPGECIAFGDAENDIEMLKYCGIGVVMGNGHDNVKPIADYVTSDADGGGIKKALEHYGLI